MRLMIIPVTALLLSGCVYEAVLDSSDLRVSNGYLNTGSAEFGALYRWDIATNECAYLDDLPFLDSDFTPAAPGQIPSTENSLEQGVELSASAELSVNTVLTPQQELDAKAGIVDAFEYQIRNYTTVTVRNTRTRMSDLLNDDPETARFWQMDDAVEDASPYRYAVIYRGLAAESAQLTRKDGGEAGAAIDLSEISARLVGKVARSESIAFSGTLPPAVVTSYIYRAYLNDANRYDFELDSARRDQFLAEVLGKGLCG